MIIDTHAHLDHVENVEQALEEASKAGVTSVIAAGVDLASNKRNLQLKKEVSSPKIYLAMGLHPGTIEI